MSTFTEALGKAASWGQVSTWETQGNLHMSCPGTFAFEESQEPTLVSLSAHCLQR